MLNLTQIKSFLRDKKYGKLFTTGIKQFGINPIVTACKSPWQNGYVERVIGNIK